VGRKGKNSLKMFHSNSTISLDISDLSLKACKLTKQGKDIFLENFQTIKVPDGYIKRGKMLKKEEIAGLIKKILTEVQNGKLTDKFINTVLPETETFVKLITVPSNLPRQEFVAAVQKEIAFHIPYNLEDIYLDWQKLNELTEKKQDQVLVGVCPKEIVEEYLEILNLAGFTAKSLEIEALPITRSIFPLIESSSQTLSSQNCIILDIGASRSSLIFWKEQKYLNSDTIEFTVSLPISGIEINKIIAQKLNLNLEQAEDFKVKYGLDNSHRKDGLLELLETQLKEFVVRINQVIDFHRLHFEGARINKILLCGGGANLKGLDKFLLQKTDIPVEYADPLINLKKEKKSGEKKFMSKEEASSYATAIGLGLKDFFL
jgi:type IV pilus assembly protein PilM